MLWRRFQDWREQRAVLKELKHRQRQEEAILADDNRNPLYLAKLAVERDQLETASLRWDEARRTMPNVVLESDDSLPILLGLKRYEEAEALMDQGRQHSPRNRRWLRALARIAQHRGDYEEAVRRWKAAQDSTMDTTEAWLNEATCLRFLGRHDEAEAVYDEVIRRRPDDLGALTERAKTSDERRDWLKSEARWRPLAERYKIGFVFAAYGRVLGELGRFDEAEGILDHSRAMFPANLDTAITRAHLAERRGDMTAACERWAELHRVAPYFQQGYHDWAECLLSVERHTEADSVMRDAIQRFPNESWPLFEYANLAHRRQDWKEAASRWEAFRRQFPDREEGYTLGTDALNAAGHHEEATALRRDP